MPVDISQLSVALFICPFGPLFRLSFAITLSAPVFSIQWLLVRFNYLLFFLSDALRTRLTVVLHRVLNRQYQCCSVGRRVFFSRNRGHLCMHCDASLTSKEPDSAASVPSFLLTGTIETEYATPARSCTLLALYGARHSSDQVCRFGREESRKLK